MTSQSLRQKLYGTHNHTVLLIQDWQELSIETIEIINGAVPQVRIHVGESSSGETWKSLSDEIDDLKHDCKVFEEEKESAESKLEDAEKDLEDLKEKYNEELDEIEDSLESAERFLFIKTSERSIHRRICELARKIEEKFDSLEEERESFKEEIRGLQVDNRALCDTITRQDERIIELEKLLTAKEN